MNKPWVVDDGICHVCDEAALPFEYGTQVGPYCALHSLEEVTDTFAEDWEIDSESEREDEERIASQHVSCSGSCCTFFCEEAAVPRVMEVDDSMAGSVNTEELCTGHAVSEYFDVYLPAMEDYIQLNRLEILAEVDPYDED